MPSITGTQISERVGILLQDTAATRWPSAERLTWINEGRREMAYIKPEIFGATAITEVTHTLGVGCKQTLSSSTAFRVVSVDSQSGTRLRLTTKEALDYAAPTWRNESGSASEVWFPDATDPLSFWVHPASSGDLKVHVNVTPPDLASLNDVALPFDIYAPALVNYVCAKALAKEDEAGALAKAQAFAALFMEALK